MLLNKARATLRPENWKPEPSGLCVNNAVLTIQVGAAH